MRGRRSAGSAVEVIAGRNPVVEALLAGVPASALYVADGAGRDDRLGEAVRLARGAEVAVHRVPRAQLDKTAGQVPHQGVLLAVRPYAYADPEALLERLGAGVPALLVALDSVTDPRNLGAIVRSAAAFGAHGVVLPERRSAGMSVAAWKASAGTAATLPVARTVNLTRQLSAYRRAGLFAVGLDASGDVALPESKLLAEPLVLVVGAEGGGLSRLVRETCDQVVAVPMAPAAESLNASVAAAVALYQIARRRA